MKTSIVLFAALVTLAGCAAGGKYVSPVDNVRFQSIAVAVQYAEVVEAFLLTGTEIQVMEKAKEATAGSLKDPGSAQFRNVRVTKYGDKRVVCGEVNGKNSYGGYVGFVPFVASTVSATLFNRDGRYPDIQSAENSGIRYACS